MEAQETKGDNFIDLSWEKWMSKDRKDEGKWTKLRDTDKETKNGWKNMLRSVI